MKRRTKQNVWGNWKAYLGAKCVHDFGTDETSAREWLAHGEWMGYASDLSRIGETFTFWLDNGIKNRPGAPEWWGK
jgi:hypothetical protein